MRNKSIVTVFFLVTVLVMSGMITNKALCIGKKEKAQTICPVMGDPINKKFYVDYEGFRIYFCCSSCPDEFKKNPEKYMKKLRDDGVTPEKTPDENAVKSKTDKHGQY